MKVNEIICGAMPEATKVFPDGSINCCISSPPYWALRDYGVDGQLGLEPTFEEYIEKLCTIYDEVKRVLRKDGTCWVNLGDTYNNVSPGGRDKARWPKQSRNDHTPADKPLAARLQTKSLCLIPQRFAIEMVNRGWILRNVIIWHKPNPMPSSAKDRFTVDFEYVYFFVKSNDILYWVRPDGKMVSKQPDYKSGTEGLDWQWGLRKGKKVKLSLWKGNCYWFESQYEPYAPNSDMEYRKTLRIGKFYRAGNQNPYKDNTPLAGDRKMTPLAEGKNKRTVWTIPTQPFPEAHFATFPEKLVEPMIKAGCPEFVCTKCGKAREKIYDVISDRTEAEVQQGLKENAHKGYTKQARGYAGVKALAKHGVAKKNYLGYTDCGCNADWRPGIVLDPFCGSGTTCVAAKMLGRKYIGIDISEKYCEIAHQRLEAVDTGVPVKERQKGQILLFNPA